MKQKLQSNDFLKNEINEMVKKKKKKKTSLWFAFFGVCTVFYFYLFRAVLKLCRETLKSKRNHT